jgi:Phasin protein
MTMRKSDKATAHDAAGLQAQLSDAWSQQASRSGETYGRLFAAMRDEVTGFVQRRVDANMATVREWYECRSLNDVLALQQHWVQSAVEQYVDQGNRIMETCRLAAADLTEAAQPAAEAEKDATERKPAAHRQAEQHLKHAA